ncbi:MAG: hypothetical protein GKR89_16705 [Candidatus Latescibacteria bacterium]|nr:hypothetical protein [Candidatus Latescibacterota bacterium]
MNEQADYNETSQTDRQSKDIDERVVFLFVQVAQGYHGMIFKHGPLEKIVIFGLISGLAALNPIGQ